MKINPDMFKKLTYKVKLKVSKKPKCSIENGFLICYCGKCEPENYPLPADLSTFKNIFPEKLFMDKDAQNRAYKMFLENFPVPVQDLADHCTEFDRSKCIFHQKWPKCHRSECTNFVQQPQVVYCPEHQREANYAENSRYINVITCKTHEFRNKSRPHTCDFCGHSQDKVCHITY